MDNVATALAASPGAVSGSAGSGLAAGLGRGAFVAGAGFCFTRWASPPVALAVGMAMALMLGNPFRRTGRQAAKWLLQGCVVLLGFGMDLPTVLRAGAGGALMAAGTIGTTLAAGYVLGRLLKLRSGTTALLCAGTAICGGSAIAAVGSAIDSDENDMTVAMGTVFLLNAAALYIFPVAGHMLGLSQQQFGVWAGVGIHDVSSVVAAGSRYGPVALQTATAVKLSRALWIVPLTFGMAYALRGRKGEAGMPGMAGATFGFDAKAQKTPGRVQVPYFIGLFLLASVLRSVVPAVGRAAPALTHAATVGLTLTLFLIGAALTRKTLLAVGWKAMTLGVALWVLISVLSLSVVRAM